MKKLLYPYIILVMLTALSRWAMADGISDAGYYTSEKTHIFNDGAAINLHYNPQSVSAYQLDAEDYADMILEDAAEAYSTIVYKLGFNSPGFTFANPDKNYRYDKDKTIDIYIGDFNDAPCYDIIERGERAYDAVIMLPEDYKGYINSWYKNEKDSGDLDLRMKATLFHEVFHVIAYSYNKNLSPWSQDRKEQRSDWYAEGLARYMETISGSFDNFFAKGFVKSDRNGKQIIFHGGVNYLMEHPHEPITEARYNYALFWAYIHKRYGMEKIEELSRRLRYITPGGVKSELPAIMSMTFTESFEDIIEGFAIALYFKHFNPEIRDGLSDLKIMSLDDFTSRYPKTLSSWGSNFITLNLIEEATPVKIAIKKSDKNGDMRMNIFCRMSSGKIAHLRKVELNEASNLCAVDLGEMKQIGVKEVILIITNVDANSAMFYNLLRS